MAWAGIIVFTTFIVLIYELIITKKITLDSLRTLSIPMSFGIALLSISIAFSSDAKMINNANMQFLTIASNFVEVRSRYIMTSNLPGALQAFLWWSKTFLSQVNQIDLKIITSENQKDMYGYFFISLREIFVINNVQWDKIRNVDRKFIGEMYTIIRKYKKDLVIMIL